MTTPTSAPFQVVAYIRASKEEQKLTLDAQHTAIAQWAAREGAEVVSWHVDRDTSSVTPVDARRGLLNALASLRAHRGASLVVLRRDRVARDVMLSCIVEAAVTKASGTGVILSVSGEGNGTTPADQFMRTVVDGAAQYERALIRSRTRAALAELRSKGLKTGGGVPFGYISQDTVHGRTLVQSPAEQATIRQARELRALGLSWCAVARRLGASPRTGKTFQALQVQRMLATPPSGWTDLPSNAPPSGGPAGVAA